MSFKKAKWIWHSDVCSKDEYSEFFDTFRCDKRKASIRLSCHDDYVLFINGKFVASNQYSDFDHYKIYDDIDISSYLTDGENTFALLVWYCGFQTMRFTNSIPGVIFEVTDEGGDILLYSSRSTPSRQSPAYMSGRGKLITSQLGPGFLYDSTKDDEWIFGKGSGFSGSCETDADRFSFFPRPIAKSDVLPPANSEIIEKSEDKRHYTVDLGAETVGLFTIKFDSEVEQHITVTYGEDLQNGHVRRIIGSRDFSFEYIASPGHNEYTNYILRLGCRYIEVYSEEPIELIYMGVLPQVYPAKEADVTVHGDIENQIYRICLNTLEHCMMEHYVDTPWREQGLYAFDSRNQMLFGYYAFENGNFDYARANLLLIGKDRRDDGLLSICAPCTNKLAIPSFSLHYFVAVNEYVSHSGDVSLAVEVYDKLVSVMNVFLSNMKDGLVCTFDGMTNWNFYDWEKELNGYPIGGFSPTPDAVINCLTVRALDAFEAVCDRASLDFPFAGIADAIRKRIKETFFRKRLGLFSMYGDRDVFNELTNCLAIISDVTSPEESRTVCAKMMSEDITRCTLSFKTMKYDALLKTDAEKYRTFILDEIKENYSKMLREGSTSAWETIDGASAFSNAGSLCHGWSATPVYYYHLLGIAEKRK